MILDKSVYKTGKGWVTDENKTLNAMITNSPSEEVKEYLITGVDRFCQVFIPRSALLP